MVSPGIDREVEIDGALDHLVALAAIDHGLAAVGGVGEAAGRADRGAHRHAVDIGELAGILDLALDEERPVFAPLRPRHRGCA